MKKEEIHLEDWQRILLGEAPAEFLVEVLIRSVVIVLIFTVAARLLGKRMNGQVTRTEMAVMLTLGAIIAPVMQLPDRGILLGALALVCIVLFQQGLTLWEFKNAQVEKLTQGTESALVRDGIIQTDKMAEARVSRQQLYAVLRSNNMYNLKQADRVYLEACGTFSIFSNDDKKPGLSVLPIGYAEFRDADLSGIQEAAAGVVACQYCGNSVPVQESATPCSVCQSTKWGRAVL